MYPSPRIPGRFDRTFRICFGYWLAADTSCRKFPPCPLPENRLREAKGSLPMFNRLSRKKKVCCALLAACFGLGGCYHEPAEAPASVTPISQMIVHTLCKGYWRSQECVVYMEKGEEKVNWVSTQRRMKQDTRQPAYACDMDIFRCTPQGSIDCYTSRKDDCGNNRLQVYRGAYSFQFMSDSKTVRLVAHHRPYAENSSYNNAALHLRSLEPDRIEFDVDLNDTTRSKRALFLPAQDAFEVRVIFTAMSDEAIAKNYINPDHPEELPLIPL